MSAVRSDAKSTPRHWEPLQRGTAPGIDDDAVIRMQMDRHGQDREAAIAALNAYERNCEYWINGLYQVQLRRLENGMVHLNIRRRDGLIGHRDWRHFQEIKNQLLGPECEAVEIYPAESRKVDTSNKFHLWGFPDPTFRFPVGWDERDVDYSDTPHRPGMRQRPL